MSYSVKSYLFRSSYVKTLTWEHHPKIKKLELQFNHTSLDLKVMHYNIVSH